MRKKKAKKLRFAYRDVVDQSSDDPEERELCYMARAILLPKNQFLADCKSLNVDLSVFDINSDIYDVYKKIDKRIIDFLSYDYNAPEEAVVRRMLDLSVYVGEGNEVVSADSKA